MKILILFFFSFFSLFGNDLKNIESFEASFEQTILNNSGKKIKYSGMLYIKKPLKILWRYDEPTQKWVYIQNATVTIIEPELEQAIVSKLDEEFNILELINNAKQVSTNQYISLFHNTEYTITLKEGELYQIAYKDNIDNRINITFSQIIQNRHMLDEMFDFDIPSEFDIIRK